MSEYNDCIASRPKEIITRLKSNDHNMTAIVLFDIFPVDQLTEMIECLRRYPNSIDYLDLSYSNCSDSSGVELAKFVASNPLITYVNLSHSHVGKRTCLAMAKALYTNTSLRELNLPCCVSFEMEFVTAFRLNPLRPAPMILRIGTTDLAQRVKKIAEELGHPTLQMLLIGCHLTSGIRPTTRFFTEK